jgi:very-short-patch-repair endonuclease
MELTQYKEFGDKGRTRIVCKCDICDNEYDILKAQETDRKKNNVICNGKNLCFSCVSKESKKRLVDAGTKALTSFEPEARRKYSSDAGKKSALSENSGRFSSERWYSMTPEDQKIRIKRANNALHEKISKCSIFKEKYYKKLFAQLKIGYISNAHIKIHDKIENLGYETHVNIQSMCVDECNEELKIVIEYNGDYWHCNPETWKPDDFNKSIKMYAKDKWRLDFKRKMKLKNLGYYVIVIWESEWMNDQNKCVNYIINKTDEIRKNNEN